MIKKKAGKNIYNPTDLEVALPRDLRGIKKKSGSERVKYPRSTLQFQSSSQLSKPSTVLPLVLCECEEHILVNWMTVTKKRFPQRKLGVQLSVKEFPTVNQRNTFLKISGNGWFRTFLHCYPSVPVKV